MDKLRRFDVWVAQWNAECTYTGNYGMWQHSDSGRCSGIDWNVDLDIAYKDYPSIIKNAKLNGFGAAAEKPVEKPKLKSIDEIAQEVLDGKWGNGAERKKKLAAAGYDVDAVQKRVNEKLAEQKAAKKLVKGAKIELNNKPIYASAYAKAASGTKTGTFYLYDGEKVNGRYKITTEKRFCGKKPVYQYVTGWIAL